MQIKMQNIMQLHKPIKLLILLTRTMGINQKEERREKEINKE